MNKLKMLRSCIGPKGVILEENEVHEFDEKLTQFFLDNKLAKLTVKDAVDVNNKEQEIKPITRKKK